MMPAVIVAPGDVVIARGAMMTDDARAMHGQHPAAASSTDKDRDRDGNGIDVRIFRIAIVIAVVIRIIVVIHAADKDPVEVAVMEEVVAGKSRASCKVAGKSGGHCNT